MSDFTFLYDIVRVDGYLTYEQRYSVLYNWSNHYSKEERSAIMSMLMITSDNFWGLHTICTFIRDKAPIEDFTSHSDALPDRIEIRNNESIFD